MRLPPGQVETKLFPVVGENASADSTTKGSWTLTIDGEVLNSLHITLPELLALPQRDLVMDVHCVTGWTRFDTKFTGIPISDLLERARPRPNAKFVQFIANSPRDHDTSLPFDVASAHCWLAHSVNGEPLSREHGGPLRTVTQGRYFYKSLKWVRHIRVLTNDVPGYWERESAYHNNADPFREERYDEASQATAEKTRRFRELDNFDEFRIKDAPVVLIKANLSNWTPRTKDLRGLQLKACDFDGADLSGVDFRGANLTLCKFFRANLAGVDFTGADLEGADFTGAASLAGARFIDAALAAAKFCMAKNDGERRGPKDLTGMILRCGRGLMESQEEYLRQRGIFDQG
ncbi:MAG: molybdopterin-dependent oxidoreductase [Planctomycetes bacterium]|nr:molybdopterin-dependent oxidoreductase [Planctomycetota bacterium]